MEFIGVEVTGFRRYHSTSMRLEGTPIAIVGPNEAGKTSFLRLLERLNDEAPFIKGDLTRSDPPTDPNHSIIRAWFALSDDDRTSVQHVRGGANVSRLIVSKAVNGVISARVEPTPSRDLKVRARAAKKLRRLAVRKWAKEIADLPALLSECALGLELDTPDLPESSIQAVAGCIEALTDVSGAEAQGLLKTLRELEQGERDTANPNTAAVAILLARRPRFLWFGSAERTLDAEYDLLANDLSTYPPALRLLSRLADIDLRNLRTAIEEEDHGAIETQIERANARLKDVFSDAWRQSPVDVHLGVNGQFVRVFARDEIGNLASIAERSDGLRAFLALIAFMAFEGQDVRPVLLVDEVELHLHYAAQADIVRVLTRQTLAAKVLYTTHSVGALPEDLGAGIRAIRPDGNLSLMVDEVWASSPGFTPIVLAMGASVVSFTPTRLAVLAEGEADAIMLPSMIREAVQIPYVGYQVGPGLSNVAGALAGQLDLEAPRVAYLVDGDSAGDAIKIKLAGAGVPTWRMVSLPAPLCTEDLLDPEVYLDCVNAEFTLWGCKPMPKARLATPGRPTSVALWAKQQKASEPSKRAVASRVVAESRAGRAIIRPANRKQLQAVHHRILVVLGRSA